MAHIHRRFSDDQVKHLFRLYVEGQMDRTQVEETLKIGKTRFFSLLKLYRSDPRSFSMAYHRRSPQRLPDRAECLIRDYLLEEHAMIEDPDLPISSFNYSAARERLLELGIRVSLSTIIERAKAMGCHRARPRRKAHSREVITTAIGALIQHDASLHRWSPFAEVKWTLISSLDDYSRKILYADFFEKETTWSHLQASEALVRRYGLPLQYYVDSLRVFRFVRSRDSFWYKTVLKTDEVNPQWKQAMTQLGIDVIYALSPQAKGKIERSYRWMQDRIVRTAAREKLVTLEQLRPILQQEVYRHNHQRVHSTTGEIPHIRFQRALKSGQSFFRPFALPAPYTSPKDIFCLKETRTVNPYRRIEFYKTTIPMPKVPIGQEVEIHLVPNMDRRSLHLRFWWENRMIHSQVFPLDQFPRVHF
jgi:hypothetical protein